MVPGAVKFIVADVAFQWVALACNIALFMVIGLFLQATLEGAADAGMAIGVLAASAAAIVVRMVCQTAAQRMGRKAASCAKCSIRQQVYDKLAALGPAYSETVATAVAVQVGVEGTEQLESYFGQYLPQLFYALLAPLTLFVALSPLSLPAAVALLVCVPLIPASIVCVQKIARRTMRNYWGSYTDLGSMFLEAIQGLTTLKIYSADARKHEEMNGAAESFRKATMRLLTMQLNSITVMDLFAFGGAAVGMISVLWQFSCGAATFAAAFSIVFLSSEFFIPMRTLGSFFHTAMGGMAAAEKMYAILDAPLPVDGAREVDPRDARVECRGVGYSYDGKRQVLEGVDFSAPRGSFIGVTGESGSGKSTLAGILSGANARYAGGVSIGGIDLRDISAESLRKTVTTVPFSSYVFKGTLRANLLLAKPDASDDELWGALAKCRLAGFVRESGGLDMGIAAEGANLSGGQRQRLAFARALLHDSPIYIFDEATSNIDAESEAAIISAARELAGSHTVIMISHRLSAIEHADEIYVLEQGKLVEHGTHSQLLARGCAYARLWESQSQLEAFAQGDGEAASGAGAGVGTAASVAADVGATPRAASGATPTPSAGAPEPPYEADEPVQPASADRRGASGAAAPRRRSNFSIMARLVGLTRPLLPVMALAIVLGVLGFLAAIFLTVFAAYGLLNAAGSWGVVPLGVACALVVVCGVVRGPLRYGEQLCNHYLAFKILALVRDKVFGKMRTLAPAKLEGRDKGDLVSLLTGDIELLEVFYAHTLSPAAIALIVSVVMVAFTATLSPLLAAYAAFSYAVVGIAVPWISSKASGTGGREVRDAIGSMNAFVLDSLRGLRETLQFGRAGDRACELACRMSDLAKVEGRLKDRTAVAMAATGAVVLALDMGMLLAAMHLANGGTIAFGPAAIACAALMSSFGPVIAVANLGSTLQQTLASGARVLDVLDESPQTVEIEDGVSLDGFYGVAASHVDFSYGDACVLSDVELSIQPGQVVRIAGRSGSGKSTLLKLFMRFWDVSSGAIEVSGRDVRRVATASLRQVEGFMTQETHLFAGTVRDNLAFAKPGASDEEIMAACEKASIADFVHRLPAGLDTQVGELGDALSGGERQRLGLARVFLHDAPFVLLDEPTSNLDALNEAAVLRALADNRAGKTVLLVSHRPSAAAIADVTYSVEHGRVS